MKPETTVFLLTLALGVVHLGIPAAINMLKMGIGWAAGPRDDQPTEQSPQALRAQRANNNFRETLPWALSLLILIQVVGKTNDTSALGAWIYLGSRVAYLPLYILGIPHLRTAAWTGSLVGLAIIALQIL